MSDLTQDYTFDLGGYVFGLGRPVFTHEGAFDPGSVTWRTQDVDIAHGDGVVFGEDFITPPTWVWTLGVDQASDVAALAEMGRLAQAWRTRPKPGDAVPLRYRVGGRTRRVYGRPRNLAPSLDNRLLSGYAEYLADFRLADALHYSDELKSTGNAQLAQSSIGGGLRSPLISPLRSIRPTSSARAGSDVVGGDAPSWAIVTIKGPVSSAVVEVVGQWRLELNMPLGPNDEVVVDPRPWKRSVILNGGGSVAGRLGRRTSLAELRLQPGPIQMIFNGAAASAGGTAKVSWRDAHHSL